MSWNKRVPYIVQMVLVKMLSDKWLSIYGLLGNFEAEIPHFGDVLHFDLCLYPRAGTLGSDVMDA